MLKVVVNEDFKKVVCGVVDDFVKDLDEFDVSSVISKLQHSFPMLEFDSGAVRAIVNEYIASKSGYITVRDGFYTGAVREDASHHKITFKNSGFIECASRNKETGSVVVRFKNQSIYSYLSVPLNVFLNWNKALSAGKYYNDVIKKYAVKCNLDTFVVEFSVGDNGARMVLCYWSKLKCLTISFGNYFSKTINNVEPEVAVSLVSYASLATWARKNNIAFNYNGKVLDFADALSILGQ